MKQYEIKLNEKEKSLFVGVMKQKLKEKGMTVYELADKMGKPVKSIYNFMSSKSSSRFLAAELADFLKIDKSEYRVKSSFFSALIGIGLGAVISAIAILSNDENFEVVQAKPIDFEKYIEKRDIETEVFGVSYPVATYNDWVPEMTEMEMTYYTDYGMCADGVTKAHEGVCAVSKDLIGMTAIIYSLDDELIGIYECCDTGFGRDKDGDGIGTIQEGKTIDIYMDSDVEGKELIREHGNRVKVQFVYANG
jgi:transcriptional regulator with XRE-family HTH domain